MAKKRSLTQRRVEREERVKFLTAHYIKQQLENADSLPLTINGIKFQEVETEWPVSEISSKKADIAILKPGERSIFVIETKRKAGSGKNIYNISPFAKPVIKQAKEYAKELKTDYYATFNGRYFVTFKIIDPSEEFDEPVLSLEITDLKKFASQLLNLISKIVRNRIKPILYKDLYSNQLKSYFDLIYPQYLASLKQKLHDQGKKSMFYKGLKIYMESIDRNIEEEKDLIKLAKEATYILIDKLLFYQLLYKTKGYNLESLQKVIHLPSFSNELRFLFQSVVDEINFSSIFSSGEILTTKINKDVKKIEDYKDVFDVPLEDFKDDIIDFIAILNDIDLNKLDATQIGYFFERVIPIEERRELGQYYTPKSIIELINKLAIVEHSATIFDPACGSGGFLVGAYNRLKELKNENSIPYNHITLLKQIKGNDVNRFPTHLSAISLAIQELQLLTHEVEILNEDFFNLFGKSFKTFSTRISTANGQESKEVVLPETFDTVVMNPPYIRQEKTNKELVNKHLKIKPLKPILDIKPAIKLSGRSDIYCYFITHAWDFLKEEGRIGAIISDRWLDTQYGESFQKILLRLFKIEIIITIDQQAFDEPLIGSVIVILQKCAEKNTREKNTVKFLRIKTKISTSEIINLLKNGKNIDVDNDKYKLYNLEQRMLKDVPKWTLFTAFDFRLTCFFNYQKRLVDLEDYSTIKRGITSGVNEFFFRKFEELENDLKKYFFPLLSKLGQVNRIQFNETIPQWGILKLDNILVPLYEKYEEDYYIALEQGKMLNKVQYIRNFIKIHHPKLYKYILGAERKKFQNRDTVKNREFWFYIEGVDPYDVCLSMFYWKVFINPIKTETSYIISDQLTLLKTKNERFKKLLCAWVNTNIIRFFIEIYAGKAKGIRLDRLRLKIFEVKQLPCPNFNLMSSSEIDLIEEKWDEILKIDSSTDFRDEEPISGQLEMREKWEKKKKELDSLFLNFIFPQETFKNKELEKKIQKNIYLSKCYNSYSDLMTKLFDLYSKKGYDDCINYILNLIIKSNQEMLDLRKKGGGEQREDVLDVVIEPINGAEYYTEEL